MRSADRKKDMMKTSHDGDKAYGKAASSSVVMASIARVGQRGVAAIAADGRREARGLILQRWPADW